MTAKKFDQGKPDMSLCPEAALEQMAYAFMVGERKYGRFNYLNGNMECHRLTAAAVRHIKKWERGEDLDTDPLSIGQSHLGNALACLAMLLDQQARGVMVDTRFKQNTNSTKEDDGDGSL